MTQADQTDAGSRAPDPARRSGRAAGALLGVAVAVALVAGGVAVWRGQKHENAVVAVAPPEPVESQAPSVDNVIAGLEARLKDKPDDAEGWRMLGWSYFQTERYADAVAALRKATRLDPEHAETFSFLGEALVLASNEEGHIPPAARVAFDKALKLDPKDARARYFRAMAMDLSGQHRRAISAWFAQLKDTPPDAPYAEDIRKAIRTVGAKYKIEVEKRLAEPQFAALPGGMTGDDIAKAVSNLPKDQQEAMIRGMVDKLEAKLKADPANADGWIMLMRSRMQLGEPDKAGKALRDALAAFRKDQNATRKLRDAAFAVGVPGA